MGECIVQLPACRLADCLRIYRRRKPYQLLIIREIQFLRQQKCTQSPAWRPRLHTCPISDSLFVSRCKTVYQIGMLQHLRH